MSDECTAFSMAAADYDRRLAYIVLDIRELADQIEREGKPAGRPAFGGTPAYAWAAHNAIRAFMWGAANLHLDALVDAAGRADIAAASGTQVSP